MRIAPHSREPRSVAASFPSYPPDNHHSWDDVDRRRKGCMKWGDILGGADDVHVRQCSDWLIGLFASMCVTSRLCIGCIQHLHITTLQACTWESPHTVNGLLNIMSQIVTRRPASDDRTARAANFRRRRTLIDGYLESPFPTACLL